MKAIKFFSLMLCFVASMSFVSCSDDDDTPDGDGISLVGEWECVEDDWTYNYTFYANGRYVEESHDGLTGWSEVLKGSYVYNDGIIEFERDETNQYGSRSFTITVLELTKNKLVIKEKNATYVYYRVNSDSDSDDSSDTGDNPNTSESQIDRQIIGTWNDINSTYKDNRSYFLQDGNGYKEYSVAYDGIYRVAFQWAVDDGVLSFVYDGGTEEKYYVEINSESMVLTNVKNNKATTYNKLNNKGTTTVDYKNPPFINYIRMYGYYYSLSKAVMSCNHATGSSGSNMKFLVFFGDNEKLTPTGAYFTYMTPYYEGINKEWSDGTYSIKSDHGYWIYIGVYCYRGATYTAAGTLKIKTVNSIKIFDFELDGGDIVGHFEGNWSYN